MRRVLAFSAFVFVFAASAQSSKANAKPPTRRTIPTSTVSAPAAQAAARASFARLPLAFEENVGQTDARVKYTSRGAGYSLFLTQDEAVIALSGGSSNSNCNGTARKLHLECADASNNRREEAALWLKFLGASPSAQVAASDPKPGKINYYIGNDPSKWRTGVRQYGRVNYRGIYPGVDLTYYGNQQQLESDFVVAPGANPNSIEFEVRGAQDRRIDAEGNLVLVTRAGNAQLLRPIIYQMIGGARHEVTGRYVLRGKNRVGFALGPYNRREQLIIDPVLVYSTYLGGSSLSLGDQAVSIVIDSAGHAYVTGLGESSDFPGTDSSGPPTEFFPRFAFVTELDQTGSSGSPGTLVYSTILSGSSGDTTGIGISLDGSGNAYVTGDTSASDFPMVNPFQSTFGAPAQSGFVASLSSTGTLNYSTYLGGRNANDSTELNGIFADASGNAYVVGDTSSQNFPTLNSYQSTLNVQVTPAAEVVVVKLNPSGQPIYSTYLGGTGSNDVGSAIVADAAGNAYVTGQTSSTAFPLTPSPAPAPFQSAINGIYNVFVTKLSFDTNTSVLSLANSTYLGGSGSDFGSGITIDSASPSDVYITGQTNSPDFGAIPFPTKNPISGTFTSGPYSGSANAGNFDAFITELAGDFSTLVFSTYLGGSGDDIATGIGRDGSGNIYVTGRTTSANFPTNLPLQTALGSSTATNVFLAELPSAGNSLTYSTYLGGTGSDSAHSIAVDSTGNVYIAGRTTSPNFPLMSGGAPGTNPFQGQLGSSNGNAFIAKISPTPATGLTLFPSSYNFHDVGLGASGTEIVTLSNNTAAGITISSFAFGGANSGDFNLTTASPSPCSTTPGFTLAAGASCLLTIQFQPQDQDTRTATFTVNGSVTMNLSGSGGAPQVSLSATSITFFPSPDPLNVLAGSGVTLTNTGGAPLLVGSAQVSPSTPATATLFSVSTSESNCFNAPIPPGSSCTIEVNFVPTAAGTFNATVLINDNAAGSPQTLAMTGVGIAEVLVQPTSLELGTQVVNSTSTNNANEASLVNGSGETINVTVTPCAVASCPDQGDFHLFASGFGSSCATVGSLGPGGSCVMAVYFQPAAASAPDKRTGSYTIGWTGTAVPSLVPGSQIVNVMGTGVSGISLYTNSITAPNEFVGFTEGSAGLEFLYNGTANPITVAIALSGNNPGDFSAKLDQSCAPNNVVPANMYCPVDLSFTPSAIGLRTTTVTFNYTGSGSPGQLVLNGSGTGIPGPVFISANGNQVFSFDFGSEIIHTTTPETVFQVHNVATVPLTIQSITPPANADFKFTPDPTCAAGTIPGGGSCFIAVTFTPSTTSKEITTFVVTDSFSQSSGVDSSSPHTITLTGKGQAAAITISVSSGANQLLDFGNVTLNPSPTAQAAIYLTNGGNPKTTISWSGGSPALATSGTAFGIITSGNTNVTTCTQGAVVLPQGASCVIGVSFNPITGGEQTNSLTFSDSVGGSHTVNIQGNGVTQGQLSWTATPPPSTFTSLTFGAAEGKPSGPQTAMLTNLGNGPLTIAALPVFLSTGTSASTFTILPSSTCNLGAVVAAGSNCVFNVTFTAPATAGNSSEELEVQANLGNNVTSTAFLDLSGTSFAGGFGLSPAGPINFGAVAVGSTVDSAFYTLTNQNATSVTFGTMTLPTGYSAISDSCSGQTVTAQNSCFFEVAFAPPTGGGFNGNLTLPFTGGSGTSPFMVALQGSGSIAVVANPNPLVFQAFVNSQAFESVTVQNGSASSATITGVSAFSGAGAADYSVSFNGCFTGDVLTASGGSCTIDINFLSATAGSISASFTVSYSINGTAQTPITVNMTANIPSAQAVITPSSLIFPSQTVNTQSQPMNVVVSNAASATTALSVSNLQISGNDFALASANNCFSVSAGQSCRISIIFTPSAGNTRNGTLTITDNSTTSTQTVSLSGTGIVGSVAVSPTTLAFPTTNVGSSVTLGAVLSNTTGSAVTFTGVTFSGPYTIDTGANSCVDGAKVGAVTGSCVVYIKFTPTGATNAGTATVNFTGGSLVIALSGTGTNPIVSASPASITFSTPQLLGTQSSPQTVTLSNGTTSTITISGTPSITTPGNATGDFVLGTNSCTSGTTVTAGNSCQVNIMFKPAATGSRTATLQIADSPDANSPHSISLSGTGTTPATIAATSGASQSATVNSAFASLQATVKDSGGNTLPGVTVTFTVTAAANGASGTFSGNVTSELVSTDANGIATPPTFTANDIPGGPYTVAATTGAVGPAKFSLTNSAGTPASITANSGTTPQSVAIDTAFAALSVTVKDSNSLPLDGVTVTFTAPASGASGTFTGGATTVQVTTNTSGIATAPTFTANSIAGGPYTVTAAAGAAGPADFSLTNLTGAPASVTATAGTPQSAAIGKTFSTNLQATVKDAGGNLLNAVQVTFTAPSSGASGVFPGNATSVQVATVAGVATAPSFTANSSVGSYTVNATVSGVAGSAAFTLNNTAGPPAKIAATTGNNQSADVTAAFSTNLAATVTDSGGNPVSGVQVTFTGPASGASGTFASPGSGATATVTTNASGVATAPAFTANSTVGSYSVTASMSGVSPNAAFSLTNTAGPPSHIAATAGTPQSATVNAAFGTNLQATVTDNGGNPVSAASVTFTAPLSGASGTFASPGSGATATVTTNASGVATAPAFTANTMAGSYTVSASVSGVTGTASFNLTNNAGAPASITATAGTPQSATISQAFTTALAATVKDAHGNLVSGASVTFTAPPSGASGAFASPGSGATATVTTNASGVATTPTFTANTVAGNYAVSASVSGVTGTASFNLTNNAGAPASIMATAGTPQSATISQAFGTALSATVKDASGNLVNGATVTFTAPSSGASGMFVSPGSGATATVTTNASGVATAPAFTANKTAGSYSVTATVTGVATGATFSLTNSTGPAASITATGGATQSVAINTAFASMQATVTDSGGNPLNGISVTFTVTPAGNGASGTFPGSLTSATVVTGANGVATAPAFTANSTPGGPYIIAAKAGAIGPANFSLTNLSAPPASILATTGSGQSAQITTAFTSSFQATVEDKNGLPIEGAAVTFTAPSSGASGTFASPGSGATATVTTNASGVATAPTFTANTVAGGPYNVTATSGTVSVNFSLTNLTGSASSITATGGATQSVQIISAYATLTATVTDKGGNPINNATVTFTAPLSGASGTFSGSGATATVATNATGVASAPAFTANSVAGAFTVTASVSGVSNKASFSLTNQPGPASKMAVSGGGTQSVAVNNAFASLAVTVTDASGNVISGVNVTFTAPASGASGTFASPGSGATATLATNASGVATAPIFIANNTVGGPYQVAASATGLTTVDFSLTNLAGTPASLTAGSGTTPQSVAINTAFKTLVANVKDNKSNPLSGVVVTFTAPSSGASGTFAGGMSGGTVITETTDVNGNAAAPAFTANSTAGGPYNVIVTAGSLTLNFALTNLAGAPATVTPTAGATQSAQITQVFGTDLAVTVKDNAGNLVSGVIVTFTAPPSGASGTFAGGTSGGTTVTATTGANGIATAPTFTANSTVGNYNVTASVSGITGSASFTLSNTPGPASIITATAGTPQSVTINAAFTTAFQAKVTDSGGNPISGASVTFTAPSSGASGTFASPGTGATATVTTNASGVAIAPAFTANSTAGSYTVNASVSGVTTKAAFSLTNNAGPPASITATAGSPQSAPVTVAFTTNLVATVKDNGSNPVSGAAVTFTAPSSRASGTFSGGGATAQVKTDANGNATAPAFTANAVGGTYNVTASVAGVSPNATFALTNTVAPDVTISLTQPVGDFVVGTNSVYTVKVTNNGTGPTTGNIIVADTLPAGLALVSNAGTGWACAAGAQNAQAITCTYSGTALAAAGGNSTLTMTVSVAPSAFPSVTNAATVSDSNDSKTTDKTSPQVVANVDNAVPTETSFSPTGGVIAGASSAQTITLTGTGFNSSTQVTLGGTAPLNTPLSGMANAAGTSLTISVPVNELAPNSSGSLTLNVKNPPNPTTNLGGGPAQATMSFPLVSVSAQQDASTAGTIAVTAGTPAMVKIDYTASSALPGSLTVTCSLPGSLTGATCTVGTGTIPAGVTSGGATITIDAIPTSSNGSSNAAPWSGGRGPWSTYLVCLVAMVGLGMLGISGTVRQRMQPLRRAPAYLTLALLVLAGGALVGCTTAKSGPTPTPTGPSTMTVTATAADGATMKTTVNITIAN